MMQFLNGIYSLSLPIELCHKLEEKPKNHIYILLEHISKVCNQTIQTV